MTLVIDTSRRANPCAPTTAHHEPEKTPITSSTTSTVLCSANTSTVTPSTGSINMSTLCTSLPCSASQATHSETLLSAIDEYLADLRLPLATTTNTSGRRVPLKLNLDHSKLSSVEQALASSPDVLRRSHLPLHFDVANPSVRRMTDEIEYGTEVVGSPAFYRCFKSGEGVTVMEDAAAFPYSPCRESVLVDERGGDTRFRGPDRYREDRSRGDVSEGETSEAKEPRPEKAGLPGIRFESPGEEESSSSDDSCGVDGKSLNTSPSSTCSSLTSCGTETKIDPVYSKEMQTNRSASDPSRFTSMSRIERPQRSRPYSPATNTFIPATSATSSPSPHHVQSIELSPTSTQIVKGVRKLNKLKQLLGDEVDSHILPSVGIAPSANRVNTMKPLPLLPRRNLSRRSKTSTSADKPRSKTCLLLATASTGRPSTAEGTPCTCAKCSRKTM